MKKLFSFVLFVILIMAVSVTAFAADSDIIASGYCGGEGDGTNLEWVLTEDGTLTISGEGKMRDYAFYLDTPWNGYNEKISSIIFEENITSIGRASFEYSKFIKSKLVLPNSLMIIEDYAFNRSSECFFGDLMIPNMVESIGSTSFYDCDGFEGRLIFGEKLERIEYDAFNGCDGFIGNVVFHKNIKTIEYRAFQNCSINEYYFEGDAPEIGTSAFDVSSDIIYYPADNPTWIIENGKWNGYTAVGIIASGYCGGEGDGTNLEWVLTEDGTLTIFGKGEMADYDAEYNSSEGYISTAPWGIYYDKIKDLVINDGAENIGNYAFYGLKKVDCKILIPETVVSIGEYAFCGSRFDADLVIPGNVKTIGAAAFADIFGKKGDLIVCEGVESIEEMAFHTEFTSAVFPSTLNNIGGELFGWHSVDNGNIVISENNPYYSIDKEILFNKNKTEIITCLKFNYGTKYYIPETVEIISNNAFKGTIFDKIIIPESVKEIKNMTFHVFRGDIVIRGKIEKIENAAISPWDNATVCVYFMNGEPDYTAGDAFRSKDGILNLYYLSGTEDLWSFDDNGLWNGYEVKEYNGYGDINIDFTVDVKDVYLARLIAAKLVVPTDMESSFGDVDGDGKITAIDANLIRKFCANIITKFPVEG